MSTMNTEGLVNELHKMLNEDGNEYWFEADASVGDSLYKYTRVAPWYCNDGHVYLHVLIPKTVNDVINGRLGVSIGDDWSVTRYQSSLNGPITAMWWCDGGDNFADKLADPGGGMLCIQMRVVSYSYFGKTRYEE